MIWQYAPPFRRWTLHAESDPQGTLALAFVTQISATNWIACYWDKGIPRWEHDFASLEAAKLWCEKSVKETSRE